MRAVLQRVKGATVHVNGNLVSRTGPGLVALIGIGTDDTMAEIEPLAKRLLSTKLWNEGQKASAIDVPVQYAPLDSAAKSRTSAEEEAGKSRSESDEKLSGGEGSRAEEVWGGRPWRSSVQDIEGEILCVSQFTLHARLSKGTKPDFHKVSHGGQQAREIYDALLERLRSAYKPDRIKDGAFGQMMDVSLTNDGPVTILVDTAEKK
ncbi:D-tyrosyl-tRNA deacylase [Ceraceosorus guamensis]|uniref:D-aminoacyl-tRNA deacylase n=1 Tax=Ceraceosorus guamensis TaxID=1522189 RepID=A0A316VTW1_9BASI|nr:D-tyrosyl-tRNA deacylase [Ceraceosorus guamensis]PWN40942.1 D-tyrosyl-tRNA deacylase [Ceraceosorus guamensis]